MKFENLEPSTRKNKRFRIEFSRPKKIFHFGQRGGNTYIDHQDELKRENYLKRHMVNEDWSEVNPGSLSAFLLWGRSSDLRLNLVLYLRKYGITTYDY
jgi:Family of unknown function (DUF5754)